MKTFVVLVGTRALLLLLTVSGYCGLNGANACAQDENWLASADAKAAPAFHPMNFGVATLDSRDPSVVLLSRNAFRPVQKTMDVQIEESRNETLEFIDEKGQKKTVVKVVPTSRIETRTITDYEVAGKQVLTCPLDSISAFDPSGKALDRRQIRAALGKPCRVVIQNVGNEPDAYFGAFLHPSLLFLQSDKWEERVEPMAVSKLKPANK